MAYIVATPRSFSQDPVYKPAPNLYEGNFRFKGFPDHAFSRPTIPRTIPGDEPVIFPPPQQPQQKAESPPPPPPAVSQRADESSAEKPTSTQQQISPPSSPKKMMDQSPPSRGSWRSRGNQQMEQQGYVPSLVEGDQMAGSRQPEWQSQPYNHNGYIENNSDQMPESRFPWQRQQWSYNISDNKPDGNEHFGTHEPFSHRDDPLNIQEYQGPAKQPASFQDSRYPPFQEHSYRSQHQGNSRFDDQASGSPRPIPIRNAYEKTDEEIRKIEQNYIEIDREKKRLREEQRQKDMEKFAEQKKDFEMLQNYDPWGKPGAGAPNPDMGREMGSTGMQTPPMGRHETRKLLEQRERLSELQSEVNEMKTGRESDSFHRRREPAIGDSTYRSSYIDKSPRNLPPSYGAHYGDFPAPDRFGKDENYPSVKYDPFDNLGRPGKALRPNYEPVRIYFPFGKSGAGAPRAYGNHRNTGTMNKEFDEQQREIKRQKQRDYNSDLSMQIAEQDRNKEAMRNHLKEPQSDMAVLMYEKQVGKPRRDQYGNIAAQHHLGNSDITRSKMNRPEMDTAMQRKYHDDLKKHVWDMQAQRNLDSLKDKQGDRRHQVTFNELWGRPGNGAPKEDTRKQKLDVTIHHPTTSFSMTDEYIRSKDWSQIGDENSPRFASYDESSPKIYPRSTVRSTHHNQYDYPWQVLQKKDYKVGAPYALH